MAIPESDVTINYSQGVLYINGGEGKVLEVVSLTGRRMLELQLDSPAQKVELTVPKGCCKVLYLDFENKGEMDKKKKKFQDGYFPAGKEKDPGEHRLF